MITVDHIETWGFEHAIRGMRNAMNSWDKSDSYWTEDWRCDGEPKKIIYKISDQDMSLMQRLYKASLSGDNHAHRKYLRQIMVSMDILAPRYLWTEFDTYKVGTTANSTSTMHKIAAKKFELDDFSYEHLDAAGLATLNSIIERLNVCRDYFNGKYDEVNSAVDKKSYWWNMIQLLPQSYNQLRTVTMNYENVFTIINQRTGHKLDEWNKFVDILWTLPYVKDIRSIEGVKK